MEFFIWLLVIFLIIIIIVLTFLTSVGKFSNVFADKFFSEEKKNDKDS
jgi:uncharacterized ion transporter superfamily protein YfcC